MSLDERRGVREPLDVVRCGYEFGSTNKREEKRRRKARRGNTMIVVL